MRGIIAHGLVALAVMTLMICVAGQAAAGMIIFSKPNDPTQSVLFSDADGQQAADNFQLTENVTLDDMGWFGGYVELDDATVSRSFKLRIFLDSGGGVPTINPFFEVVVIVAGVDTGTTSSFGSKNIFQYVTTITPVDLTAGTEYWISILENDLTTNIWFWQASNSVQNETAAFRPQGEGNWLSLDQSNRNEFAFSLSATPIPEPSTMLLLGFGLAGLVIVRWRGRRVR